MALYGLLLLYLLQVVYPAEARLYFTSPKTVYVPHIHTTDYTVWENITASCYVIIGETTRLCNFLIPPICRDVVLNGGGFKPCDRCEITGDHSDMFYEQDMNVMKKSCTTSECSSTCSDVNCIPAGETVTVDVRCWKSDDETKQNVTSILKVISVSNSSISGCFNNTYGKKCTSYCGCITNNTIIPEQSCDPYTGSCRCLPAWKGDICNIDIDECKTGNHDCDTSKTSCQNTVGGFECVAKDYLSTENEIMWIPDEYMTTTTESEFYRVMEDEVVLPLEIIVGLICAVVVILLLIAGIVLRWRLIKPTSLELSRRRMHISCIDILQNPEARARSNSRDSGVYYEISWDNPLHESNSQA